MLLTMRKNLLITLAFGVGLGLFTSFGQSYLPDPLTQLANSYSIWLLFAFVCGMYVSRYRWAAVSGALIQYIALATYYALIHVRFTDGGFNMSSNIIWLVGGTLVGPIAGIAGKLYAVRSRWSAYGLSLIVGVILSESLYQFLQLQYVSEGLIFLALAIMVTVALLWNYRSRLQTIIPIIAVTALAYIGYTYVLAAIFN